LVGAGCGGTILALDMGDCCVEDMVDVWLLRESIFILFCFGASERVSE
jgi:hypothetical protein